MKKLAFALPILLLVGCMNDSGGNPNPPKEDAASSIQKQIDTQKNLSPEAKAQLDAAKARAAAISEGMKHGPPGGGGGGG